MWTGDSALGICPRRPAYGLLPTPSGAGARTKGLRAVAASSAPPQAQLRSSSVAAYALHRRSPLLVKLLAAVVAWSPLAKSHEIGSNGNGRRRSAQQTYQLMQIIRLICKEKLNLHMPQPTSRYQYVLITRPKMKPRFITCCIGP